MQGQLKQATQEWATLVTQFPWRKVLRVAPAWVAFIMVIMIAKLASDTTWLFLTPEAQVTSQPANKQVTHDAAVASPRLSKVANLHLFGVSARTKTTTQAPISASDTNLNLKLTGVMYSTVPENSVAFIANAKGDEGVYAIGDTIKNFNGVSVKQIHSDHVILLVGGQHQRLPLQKLAGSSTKRGNTGPRVISGGTKPRTNTPGNVPTKTINKKAGPRLKKVVDTIVNNPQQFYEQMRIVPVQKDGQTIGIKFSHDDRSVMRELGLRSTDIILEVNGTPATDPAAFVDLMNSLSSVQQIELLINRRGYKQLIVIQM